MNILPRGIARVTLAALATVAMPSLAGAQTYGSGSVALGAGGYTQDFDTLASSGTSSSLPAGWYAFESGSNANTVYTAGTGSGTSGDVYSFGSSVAPASGDRAFGTLQSGSLIPTIGAVFSNATGSVINGLTIGYTGEQWRNGSATVDSLNFQYSLTSTTISDSPTSTAWISVSGLNFTAPSNATVGALDGNLAANRAVLTATVSNLAIASGASFAFRWVDFDAANGEDGLAVDDFSVSAVRAPTPAVPEPATWAMMIGGFGLVGSALRRRAAQTVATA